MPPRRWDTIYQTLALADNQDAPSNMFLGRELGTRLGHPRRLVDGGCRQEGHGRLNPKFQNFKEPVASLSGGQRQSVAIARAGALQRPDPDHGRADRGPGPGRDEQVRELMRRLKSEGIGISHDIHDVFDLADRISVMLQGKLVGTVNKDDVTMDEVLAMIIIGKMPEEGHRQGAGTAPRPDSNPPLSERPTLHAYLAYSQLLPDSGATMLTRRNSPKPALLPSGGFPALPLPCARRSPAPAQGPGRPSSLPTFFADCRGLHPHPHGVRPPLVNRRSCRGGWDRCCPGGFPPDGPAPGLPPPPLRRHLYAPR